jgi:hypothetical protein
LSSYGAPVQVFLPWPATESDTDRFYSIAPSQSELVGPMAACDPPMGLSELLPCVRFRHEKSTGQSALSVGGLAPFTAPVGGLFQYGTYLQSRDRDQTVPFARPMVTCPHTADCALASVCHQRVYASYAKMFGLDEMQPVAAWELLEFSLQARG